MRIKESRKKPDWLKIKLPNSDEYGQVLSLIKELKLNTVCQSAKCPNRNQCWSEKTATFMILGDICSRNCCFCGVEHGQPETWQIDEAIRVAKAVFKLKLKHAVVTSVTRDDLEDGGAKQFAQTIKEIRKQSAKTTVEVLVPDFAGKKSSAAIVFAAKPDVFAHNLETVPKLYSKVRPGADYQRSLELLRRAKAAGLCCKSGLMLGLSENKRELKEVFNDLAAIKLDILTIGQYLQPTSSNLPVSSYLKPEEFTYWQQLALQSGIKSVVSGPLVRSSFRAQEALLNLTRKDN